MRNFFIYLIFIICTAMFYSCGMLHKQRYRIVDSAKIYGYPFGPFDTWGETLIIYDTDTSFIYTWQFQGGPIALSFGHYKKIGDTILCTPTGLWLSEYKGKKAISTPEEWKNEYTMPFKCVKTKDGIMKIMIDHSWYGETYSIRTEGRLEVDTFVEVKWMVPGTITTNKKLINKAINSF